MGLINIPCLAYLKIEVATRPSRFQAAYYAQVNVLREKVRKGTFRTISMRLERYYRHVVISQTIESNDGVIEVLMYVLTYGA